MLKADKNDLTSPTDDEIRCLLYQWTRRDILFASLSVNELPHHGKFENSPYQNHLLNDRKAYLAQFLNKHNLLQGQPPKVLQHASHYGPSVCTTIDKSNNDLVQAFIFKPDKSENYTSNLTRSTGIPERYLNDGCILNDHDHIIFTLHEVGHLKDDALKINLAPHRSVKREYYAENYALTEHFKQASNIEAVQARLYKRAFELLGASTEYWIALSLNENFNHISKKFREMEILDDTVQRRDFMASFELRVRLYNAAAYKDDYINALPSASLLNPNSPDLSDTTIQKLTAASSKAFPLGSAPLIFDTTDPNLLNIAYNCAKDIMSRENITPDTRTLAGLFVKGADLFLDHKAINEDILTQQPC